jgi:predicted permease
LRLNVNDTLKSGARGTTGGRGHQRFRHALIIGQFALAMVLLAGAALYVRAFNELSNSRGGWESSRLVTGTVVLPTASYGDPDKINIFHRLTLERLRDLPGVASVSISSFTPFFNWGDVRKYIVEGRDLPQPGQEPAAIVNSITSSYFDTYQTRIVAGRAFTEQDTLASTKVFIVSQNTATSLFGNENPIGRRLAQTGADNPQWGEIVGVAADVKPVVPDPGPVTLQLYQPMSQDPRPYNEIAVRTTGAAPSSLVVPIRNAMTQLDSDLPVRQLQAADVTIERANTQTAILRDMLASFAVLGVGLASLGIYGVIARTMTQRTGEFAIRFALGACTRDITTLVLISGAKLAAIGLTLGLIGALGLTRLLVASNPGMRFSNPLTMVLPALLLLGIALVASWLTPRRAARINPIEALRAE